MQKRGERTDTTSGWAFSLVMGWVRNCARGGVSAFSLAACGAEAIAPETITLRLGQQRQHEAEDASTVRNDATAAARYGGYTGDGYLDFGEAGASVQWNEICPEVSGEQTLTFRYANADSGNRRAEVRVNGGRVGELDFSPTGAWDSWRLETLLVDLDVAEAATITVRALTERGGPNLDHLVVAGHQRGPGTAVWYQAEDFDSRERATVSTAHEGSTCRGFMDYGADGSWIQWDRVGAAARGPHALSFRYANGGASSRPTEVYVNGSPAGRLDFPVTGSWSTWAHDALSVVLEPGPNSVRLVATTPQGGPNLDAFTIVDEGDGGEEPTGCAGACASFELPVEVLGSAGTRVSRSFALTANDVSRADSLYLEVNNLSYENKARVRVNGGSWLSLNHGTVSMPESQQRRGGMVHGGYNTVQVAFPVPGALHAGENTVEFEYFRADGLSIGYRVVAFNVLDAQQRNLLPDQTFFEVDPETWEAPLSDRQSVTAGGRLWRQRNLLAANNLTSDGWWYASTLPAGQNNQIRASCADCHVEDGRDLEIFAYSNFAIIERARFHGLSTRQGEQIASYIRSLSDHPEIDRSGRPWNPPFQPGPSLAGRPVHRWPAGAGLDAVLDHDADMLDFMFPSAAAITEDQVRSFFNREVIDDVTLQPLAIQFPDWKHWLPLVHPMDAFSRNAYWERNDLQHNPRREYERAREALEEGSLTKDQILQRFFAMSHAFRNFLQEGAPQNQHWRSDGGNAFEQGLADGISKELAATSLARTQAVKFFELHTVHSLMGRTDDEPGSRPRQFIGRHHQVFNVPPHFTGGYDGGRGDHFRGQPAQTGDFETTAWYQLQQVLNPGNAAADFTGSLDYNYHPMFILRASGSSGICEPVRFFYAHLIQSQTRGRTQAPPEDRAGFYMRQQGPWQFLGADNRNQRGGMGNLELLDCLDEVQPGLAAMFVGAQLRLFNQLMAESRNALDAWPRRPAANAGNDRYLEAESVSQAEMPNLNQSFEGPTRHYVHKIYASMRSFAGLGVDCEVFNDYRAWARRAWPNVNWNRSEFRCD